jgi:hypothetical protein
MRPKHGFAGCRFYGGITLSYRHSLQSHTGDVVGPADPGKVIFFSFQIAHKLTTNHSEFVAIIAQK